MAVQKSKVTIFDVAKASGVSSSAVSYALNGKSGVSEDTRAKVLKIAHELGWKPNGAAQAIPDGRIGFLVYLPSRTAMVLERIGSQPGRKKASGRKANLQNEEHRKRKVSCRRAKSGRGKYTSTYSLSENTACGGCGAMYRRTMWIKRDRTREDV